MTPGTFPCPNGVSTTFSNVMGSTANFTLLDPGQYVISWEPQDPNNAPTVTLNQVQAGANVELYHFTGPGGYQNFVIPPGGMTLNWAVTLNNGKGAARLSVTLLGSALSLA